MKKIRLLSAAVLLLLPLSLTGYPFVLPASAQTRCDSAQIQDVAIGIIDWKKLDNGSTKDGPLINDAFLELAGTTPGDWYPIGLSRLGKQDAFENYLAVIRDVVQKRYEAPEKLSAAKATEWHRISLAILAAGGDPTNAGTDAAGKPINLIADGTYDRGKTAPLGKQGINGWIWGLIALDAKRYDVPAGSFNTCEQIIIEILQRQLADGGFALSGKTADPDITAMAIQSIAPYYNDERTYSYTKKSTSEAVTKTVRAVVDEALACLSKIQQPDGDFASWGMENVESTVQVAVALCCLGIDPQSDARFIKGGKTLLDGILKYRMKDGGFVHSFTYDADNPTSLPDQSNSMAGEQTLYCMAALWRQMNGMRTLYDFRPEQSDALRQRIASLQSDIAAVTPKTGKVQLETLLRSYYSIDASERSYVYSYAKLSDAAKKAGIDVAAIAAQTPVTVRNTAEGEDTPLGSFSLSDRKEVDALPKPLTTKEYVEVVRLLTKLGQSEDFDGKDAYRKKLTQAKSDIEAVQTEIDSINADVKAKLYPFNKMRLCNKGTVDTIVRRVNALSKYDQAKIERREDILKTKTKIDNLLRAVVITVVLAVAAAVLLILVIRHIRRRRHKKRREMEELAAQYEDEP